MVGIEHLELMPEPDDSRLLTAVDPAAPGYPGVVYGKSDEEALDLRWPMGPMKEYLWPWGAVSFAIGTVLLLITWPFIQAYLIPIFPDSEWAYESTGIRELQSQGLYGEGIHICIVDTGIDIDHPDFDRLHLRGFRDFYANQHDDIRDVGEEYHGTLMAGLLVANGTFIGAAPEVSLSIALALGPEGRSGQADRVAQAIRWCRITQNVDIISLSLGGDPSESMAFRSETVEAVIEALDAGIFVVAAAGNNGMRSSVDDVSVPASLVGVIAVGASTSKGGIWLNSSKGSETDPHSGLDRVFPNQKPEITAPGVRMFSTASTSISPPYAYSSGTSDSTVLVAGALALILELYGDAIRGEDGILDADEMSLVKRALATSALAGEETDSGHHQKRGYGDLNAVSWAEQVAFELNLD